MAAKYVTVQITRPARAALHRLQLLLSADAGRRLTLAETVAAASVVAERHRSEAVKALELTD
jgi:hypothetical protein